MQKISKWTNIKLKLSALFKHKDDKFWFRLNVYHYEVAPDRVLFIIDHDGRRFYEVISSNFELDLKLTELNQTIWLLEHAFKRFGRMGWWIYKPYTLKSTLSYDDLYIKKRARYPDGGWFD